MLLLLLGGHDLVVIFGEENAVDELTGFEVAGDDSHFVTGRRLFVGIIFEGAGKEAFAVEELAVVIFKRVL